VTLPPDMPLPRLAKAITVLLPLLAPPAVAGEWSLRLEHTGSTERDRRDMDVTTLTFTQRVKEVPFGSIHAQAGVLVARGTSLEAGGAIVFPADANGVFAGAIARFEPQSSAPVLPFFEIGLSALVSDRELPDRGFQAGLAGRLFAKADARMGVGVAVSQATRIEGALAFTHFSNGRGLGPDNISYDGIGLSLGWVQSW